MMGYAIEQDPAPMLLVMPTSEIAVYVSRNRFQPMVDSIPALRHRKPTNPDEFNLKEMNFAGMVLTMAGANSAPDLATRPVRYVFFDEVDKYPAYAGREGEPISLATERARTFWNRKIVKISTPTTANNNIWKAFNAAGLRYEYYVPCPFCGEMQTLIFWGEERGDYRVRWHNEGDDYDIEKLYDSTWYECPFCKEHILDYHKMSMLSHGEWRDQHGVPFEQHEGRSRSVGFHINALYSPWVTFGEMAVTFLKSKDSPEKYMNFENLWLGKPTKAEVSEVVTDRLHQSIIPYNPDIIPDGALTLIASVDVQKYYLQFVIRAWSMNMESWLIREGQVESFSDLREVLENSSYQMENSDKRMVVRLALIDSGFRSDEVYDFVRLRPRICRATKGASHPQRAPYTASKIDTYPDGTRMPGGLTLWLFDTNYWKDALSRRINLMASADNSQAIWHVYKGVSEQYLNQLTAEEKVITKNRRTGRTTESWQLREGRKRNETFDLEVMNLMGADMVGLKYFAVANSFRSESDAGIQKRTVLVKKKMVAKSRWMTQR
jgi:phage terminase large subunit GpA-like protein